MIDNRLPSHAFRLSQEDFTIVLQIASDLEYSYRGKPSLSQLFKAIAKGEVQLKKDL